MELSDLGEPGTIARIAHILEAAPLPPGWQGIGDDASVCDLGAGPLLTTVDMLVEGVHFQMNTTAPWELGWKALAVNVSDVYSMGGIPRWAVVAIALRGDLPISWLEGLYDGLSQAAAHFACPIVGGDTVGTPGPVAISVTVVGTASNPRLRSAARPGDVLAVTGPLGLSAAGFWAIGHPDADLPQAARLLAERAHRRPTPPGYPAPLGSITRMALMDDSDGLGTAAQQIAAASRVAVVLEAEHLMPDDEVAAIASFAGVDPLDWRLWGGEDYGLVAAFEPTERLPSGFFRVGRCEQGAGAHLERGNHQGVLDRRGYRHF